MKHIYFRLLIVILLLPILTNLHAQQLRIEHFNNDLVYAPGSGISLVINPLDTFTLENQFILELIAIDFDHHIPLKTLNEFYIPAINAILPADLASGEYKLRVRTTQPISMIETEIFNVSSDTALDFTRVTSAFNNNTNFFNCLACQSEEDIFGSQNQQEGASTSTLNQAQRTMQICNYDADAEYLIQLVSITTDEKSVINQSGGAFLIPEGLAIGTYVFLVEKTKNNISDSHGIVFIFHGNGTSLGNSSSEEICVESSVIFNVDITAAGIGRNYMGSKYIVHFGDDSPALELTQAQLLHNSKIQHIYHIPSCSETGSYFSVQSNMYSKGIQNSCDIYNKNGNGVTKRVNVSKPPVANIEAPTAICLGKPLTIKNITVPGFYGTAGCKDASNFFWYYKRPGEATFTYINNKAWVDEKNNLKVPSTEINREGCWEFKLEAQNQDLCQLLSEAVQVVMVEKEPTVDFSNSTDSICENDIVNFTNMSSALLSTCSYPSFKWSVTAQDSENSSVFNFANETKADSQDASLQFTKAGIYHVTLTVSNSCGALKSTAKEIFVFGKPQLGFTHKEISICHNAATSYIVDFADEAYNPNYKSGTYGITNYNWTVSSIDNQEGDFEFINETNAQSAYPVIRFNAIKEYQIEISLNGLCEQTNSDIMRLKINKTPDFITPLTSETICSGEFSNQKTLKGNMDGLNFRWEITKSDNLISSIPSTGEGSEIASEKFMNHSDSVAEVIFSVTPYNERCIGDPQTFSIKVNPEPYLLQPTQIVSCASDMIEEIVFANTLQTASTFYWYNSDTEIGLGASGVGNTPAFRATNVNNNTIVSTITVIPTSSKDNSECQGESKVFEIKILPKIKIQQVSNFEMYNSQILSEIYFKSNVTDGKVKYIWTNTKSTIGIAAQGVDMIPAATLKNLSNSPTMAEISVVALYEFEGIECQSEPMTFTIKVNPTPIAVLTGSTSVCSGAEEPKVTFAGTNGIAPYTFTYRLNDGDIQVISTTNATNAISFSIPTNTSNIYVYKLISISDATNNCINYQSDSVVVEIVNNPLIKTNPLKQQQICVGGTIEALVVEFDGGIGESYVRWYSHTVDSNNEGTLLQDKGTNQFIPEAFLIPGEYYFYAMVISDGSNCGVALSETAKVTVLADPKIVTQPISKQAVCKNSIPETLWINASGGIGDFEYQWYSSKSKDFITFRKIENATQNSYIPHTSMVGTIYYLCEVQQSNAGCAVFSDLACVETNEVPQISSQPLSYTLCKDEALPILSVKYKYGNSVPKYQWYENKENNTYNGNPIPQAVADSFQVKRNSNEKWYYYCVIQFDTEGCGQLISHTAEVQTLQYPVLNDYFIETASGLDFEIIPQSNQTQIIPERTRYSWSFPKIEPEGSVTGASEGIDMPERISQKLFNKTNDIAWLTYKITPEADGCSGKAFEIQVKLQPAIQPNIRWQHISCNGSNDGSIRTNISGGIPYTQAAKYHVFWTGPEGFSSTEANIQV